MNTVTANEIIDRDKKIILVVDDEPAFLRVVCIMLKSMGCEVVAETDPREALSIFTRNPDSFSAVITDQLMPHMTGQQLAARILDLRPDLPVIMCTGYSELLDKNRALGIGCQGFLMKPFSRDELEKTVVSLTNNNHRKGSDGSG